MTIPPAELGQPPGDGPGSVVYEITYNDEHVLGLWRHSRQSKRRSRLFMRVFRVAAGVVLAGLIVLVLWVGHWQYFHLAVALLGILGVLLFSEQIDGWRVVRRWRKALYRNKQARIVFHAEGSSVRSDLSQGSTKWAAYTVAVRYPDGFLIFSGPFLPHWFPDAALIQGTATDAATLFKANVPDYQES